LISRICSSESTLSCGWKFSGKVSVVMASI
jgi:hypothetical protein